MLLLLDMEMLERVDLGFVESVAESCVLTN